MMNGQGPAPQEDGAGRDGERVLDERVLDEKVQNHLGGMLKRHYDDILNAPIPDQFLVLLAQLEAREQSDAKGAGDDS